ncbi:uncharacterized protein LOC135563666 [Oncorhynchus nerka]|uniref:uncharacterized protein LOC135563666 n=1 Tax=Oncorhynchus nerka TaxID=8023 RepID=UPI0031B873D5
MAVMIGIAFRVSWLCCLLIGGITCSISEGNLSPALDSNAAWLYAGSLQSLGYGNYNSPKSQMQAQQKHPAAILRKELAPMSQQPQQVWYPAQIPLHQKQPAAEAQPQTQPTTVPQQVWHPAHMLQQKQLSAVPQQVWHPAHMLQQTQPSAVPQQVWHPAQMPLQQLAPMSQQKHYESTEDASGSSQASIVERSGVIPSSSYSSKSHKNGRTVFSQISYTPREAMPVDSGNAPKDGYVSIGAPSIYLTLVKDSAREI